VWPVSAVDTSRPWDPPRLASAADAGHWRRYAARVDPIGVHFRFGVLCAHTVFAQSSLRGFVVSWFRGFAVS
jgi:hypothetical protein